MRLRGLARRSQRRGLDLVAVEVQADRVIAPLPPPHAWPGAPGAPSETAPAWSPTQAQPAMANLPMPAHRLRPRPELQRAAAGVLGAGEDRPLVNSQQRLVTRNTGSRCTGHGLIGCEHRVVAVSRRGRRPRCRHRDRDHDDEHRDQQRHHTARHGARDARQQQTTNVKHPRENEKRDGSAGRARPGVLNKDRASGRRHHAGAQQNSQYDNRPVLGQN